MSLSRERAPAPLMVGTAHPESRDKGEKQAQTVAFGFISFQSTRQARSYIRRNGLAVPDCLSTAYLALLQTQTSK